MIADFGVCGFIVGVTSIVDHTGADLTGTAPFASMFTVTQPVF